MTTNDLVRINGALCVQRGTPMLQAYIDPVTLGRHSRIDVYNPHATVADTGYQRTLVKTRVAGTAAYYEGGGRMPNPLLLNIRERDFNLDQVHVNGSAEDKAAFENAVRSGGDWMGSGYIEFADSTVLWLYDGQHRHAGLKRLLEQGDAFARFPVPVSLTLGLPPKAELKEFYEVNSKSKSVKTDLALTLLKQLVEDDPDLEHLLEVTGKDWQVKGQDVLAELEKLDGPWQDRFQLANTRKRRGDGVVMAMPQFVGSLKPVLDMPILKRAEPEKVAAILNAYWCGIAKVLPEPFAGSPEDFVIQKGPGTVALHRVFPQVVEVIRSRGRKLGDVDAYAEVLQELPDLEGTAVVDGEMKEVSGAEFWRVGSVASGFSGDSGRRHLALLIQSLLPKPSDEIDL